MPRKIVDDRAWLAKHLTPLMEAGRKLLEYDSTLPVRDPPTYDRGYWTGLKLIALKYYLQPYLNILANRTKVAYIDFFAGPGLNRIGKRRVAIPGSPLLPLMIHEAAQDKHFRHYFVCEANESYFEALTARMSNFMDPRAKMTPFHGDANEFVAGIPKLLRENGIGHSLVFVDPEGLEWAWDSMRLLVEKVNCDVIVNFPSSGLQRISTRQDARSTICAFLGMPEDELPTTVDEEWALGVYRSGLAQLGKDISTEVKITDYGAFHYHLIPAVRRTYTGSKWFGTWIELRRRVERLHGEILNMVAQQIDGVQGTIA